MEMASKAYDAKVGVVGQAPPATLTRSDCGRGLGLPAIAVSSLICHPARPPERTGVRERSGMSVRLGPESKGLTL